MLYKTPFVLCLYIFLYHQGAAEGNTSTSSTSTAASFVEDPPGTQRHHKINKNASIYVCDHVDFLMKLFSDFQQKEGVVFCAEETVDVDEYGPFHFEKTEATIEGVEVTVPCTYGFRYDGFESFTDGQPETKEMKEAKSGATRKCFLIKDETGIFKVGQWGAKTEVVYCKGVGRDTNFMIWNYYVTRGVTSQNFDNVVSKFKEIMRYIGQGDHEFAAALINGIDRILRSPALGPDALSPTEKEHMLFIVQVEVMDILAEILPPGQKSTVGDNGIIVETAVFYGISTETKNPNFEIQVQPYVTSFSALEATTVVVNIPIEALQMSMKNVNKNPVLKITALSQDVISYQNQEITTTVSIKLDECETETVYNECETSNSCCKHSFTTGGSWGKLSIELDGIIKNLTQPIGFEFMSSELSPECNITCVYINNEGEMSTEGLHTIQLDDGVKCTSNHLTVFSALIEPLPLPFPDAEYAPINNSVHSYILSILSSIGSVCSIIGLSFTLITYGLFRSLRKERSNRILINLSFSLLLMHIMSISGSKSFWDGYCFVPAASLHYLVLTSLAWMMVEAIHMFELLISVFVRPENRFLIKRLVLAWGIPLIVVAICTILQPEVYTVGRADLCLMSAHKNIILYYVAYIGPICAMLLVNIIIFVRIFKVLYQQTKRTTGINNNNRHKSSLKYHFVKISPSQMKGATTVLVLFGIGWALGLLAIGPFEVFFRYTYCVCNAGQGLFIFIFRVVLNPHASKLWKKTILGLSPDNSLDTSVISSVSGKKRKSTIVSPTFISASNSVENSLTPSNPLSTTLATTLANILRSEAAKAATSGSISENQM